ncbi:MAG TPA: DUF1553 domain-containing protein [Chthonomonadales bacterium]|nr:DUF1553 domain-containing protein [Chthonomonadales bacterium]
MSVDTAGVTPYELNREPTAAGMIDELVFARLRRLGIRPARPASDSAFLRRASLGIIGTLPTAAEARAFLSDASPTKRRDLVEGLLAREEYADYWAMRWCDALRVKAEFPINLWPNAVQAYHRWVRTCLRDNVRYDRFARELLTASGSNFRVAPVNFYRALQGRGPEPVARVVALTLMGARADRWPPARLRGMAAFFSRIAYKPTGEWKEEIVQHDGSKGPVTGAAFPDGTRAVIAPGRDPREAFAAWLTAPGNPWFASAAVNRVWAWMFGRGIVHEPDDIRPGNPPGNPELLAHLERSFVASGYDLRGLIRTIALSSTYQLSCVRRSASPAAESQFAFYPLRRLDAEVLIDAINQITGTTESYSSAIPEPFTFIPERVRSIALADGSITSSFLQMFGRPARDTGMFSERNNSATAAQRLHLLNSSHIRNKIERGPAMLAITRSARPDHESVETLYLTMLSRSPTEGERAAVGQHLATAGRPGRSQAMVDLAWALLNSPEFLFRH